MRFYELLPWPKEQIEAEAFKLLVEIHGHLANIEEERQDVLRARNERLSSYLGTLNTLLSAQRQKLHHQRNKYIAQHPKPEKGVTEWREDVEAQGYDTKLLCEHVETVIKAIETRLSITQSNLRSMGQER